LKLLVPKDRLVNSSQGWAQDFSATSPRLIGFIEVLGAAGETILVEHDGRVATITLNRPKALNALNGQVMAEVTAAAAEFDADDRQRAGRL
jgi:hypothetical protein